MIFKQNNKQKMHIIGFPQVKAIITTIKELLGSSNFNCCRWH